MTRPYNQTSNPKQPAQERPIEGSSSNLLTLDNAGPVQMGFWVPNRVWATAKFLVPLRDYIAAKKKAGTLTTMIPEIQEFKAWVTSDSVYRMWVNSMIDQANAFVQTLDEKTKEQIQDQDGDVVWIKDYDASSKFSMRSSPLSFLQHDGAGGHSDERTFSHFDGH